MLVLRDVLGLRAAEVAEMLDSTEASVNSALQRARAALDDAPAPRERAPLPDSPDERAIVARFADAFERGDIEGVVALLTDDALLTMPPQPLEYEGREAIAEFFRIVPAALGFDSFRFTPTRANGQPALLYERGIIVLTLEGDKIAGITRFPLERVSASARRLKAIRPPSTPTPIATTIAARQSAASTIAPAMALPAARPPTSAVTGHAYASVREPGSATSPTSWFPDASSGAIAAPAGITSTSTTANEDGASAIGT